MKHCKKLNVRFSFLFVEEESNFNKKTHTDTHPTTSNDRKLQLRKLRLHNQIENKNRADDSNYIKNGICVRVCVFVGVIKKNGRNSTCQQTDISMNVQVFRWNDSFLVVNQKNK